MAKVTEFQWQIPVPEVLLKGAVFDRWDEVSPWNAVYDVGFVTIGIVWTSRLLYYLTR